MVRLVPAPALTIKTEGGPLSREPAQAVVACSKSSACILVLIAVSVRATASSKSRRALAKQARVASVFLVALARMTVRLADHLPGVHGHG